MGNTKVRVLGGLLFVFSVLWMGTSAWAVLDHFGFTAINNISSAGQTTNVTITAYDAVGNTELAVGGATTLAVYQGGAPLNSTVSTYGPTSVTFTNGIANLNVYVRKVGFNYSLRATNGSVVTDSSFFGVLSPEVASKYLVIMPGQAYTPGERYGATWGRNSAPATNVTAGIPINVSVVVTDLYGNKVSTVIINANAALIRTDAGATFPSPISIISGSAYPSVTLTAAWTSPMQQAITVSDGVSIYTQATSGFFTVNAAGLHHFSVGNIGSNQTAGSSFNPQITAQDTFNNPVTTFVGPVYITCPLLDYHNPEQTIINVTGGTNAAGVTWTTSGGFTNGVWSNSISVYRAGTASVFVSDQADGMGHTGTSSTFQVDPGTFSKMFMLVPGLTYRPGSGGGAGNSLGGYAGIPLAQVVGTSFNVTVCATDDWWNQVPGTSSGFQTFTQPSASNIQGSFWSVTDGIQNLNVIFTTANSYTLTADNNTMGITDYTSPYYIPAASLDHFKITSPDGVGGLLPADLVAGVPFNVTVVAYADAMESTVVSTFNGQVDLVTSLDYSDPYRVISPQRITLTNGWWHGQVVLYRQTPTGINVACKLGSVTSVVGNQPKVHHNQRRKMLALAPGMSAQGGIAPDTYPPGGFPGYTGNPVTQEAGQAFSMNFYLCDDYWNVVTNTAQGGNHSIRILSSDPYPASMGGSNLPQIVNLTSAGGYPAGAYTSSNIKLFTVGNNGYQTLSVQDLTDSGVTDFVLGGNGVPPINVRHTYLARVGGPGNTYAFKIEPTTSVAHVRAGVPFWCTITAQDQYGNIMDNRNGATAFSNSDNINLALGSGTNTLFPTIAQLPNNGQGTLLLTAYKNYTGNSVNASYADMNGMHIGYSPSFWVDSNTFTRLIPVVPGMNILGGGVYTSQPPTQFIGYSGTPSAQTAGILVNVQVYACDTYGNVTAGSTDVVTLTSTDIFAPAANSKRIEWASGYADFSVVSNQLVFHKAAPAAITAADTSNGAISSGTTPYMTVNPGTPYGLTTIAPGQILVEGSGNSGTSGIVGVGGSESWYTGVTATSPKSATDDVYRASAELSGVNFPVTITAVDVFGNRCNSVNDSFQLQSSDPDGSASPRIGSPVIGTLSSGLGWVLAKLISLGGYMIYPQDTTNVTLTRSTNSTRSDITVVTLSEMNFRIFINNTESSVGVSTAPATFTVKVQVRDDYNQQIVSSANVNFVLEAYTNPMMSTPGNGVLGVTSGQTLNGEVTITETYNYAETIYIRVREAGGASRPTQRTSAQINVTTPGPTPTVTPTVTTTATVTPTATISATITPTRTVSTTATTTPSSTVSATVTPTRTISATATITPSITVTSTHSPSATVSPTLTHTTTPGLDVERDFKGKSVLAYPNPGKDTIRFAVKLEKDGLVKISLYNLYGERVSVLQENMSAGTGTITWASKNVASGIYFAQVTVDGHELGRLKICVAH